MSERTRAPRRLLPSGPTLGWLVGEAAQLGGIPEKTLRSWATTGFLVPTVIVPMEKHLEATYGLCDVVAIVIARELLEAKAPRPLVREILPDIQLAHRHEHSVDCDDGAREGDENCHLAYRGWVGNDWWMTVDTEPEDPPETAAAPRWWPRDKLAGVLDGMTELEGSEVIFLWTEDESKPWLFVVPFSVIVERVVASVDGWRRANSIPKGDLDPWQ